MVDRFPQAWRRRCDAWSRRWTLWLKGHPVPASYLSSLDPGVRKTTTLIHFIRALLGSAHHGDEAVLVGLSRLDEIKRLVEEVGLNGNKTHFIGTICLSFST